MAGKLNVYGLGSLGVNVDKNAVNLEDGELTQAQNAIHDATGAMGGLRKRPGLNKLNSGAVSGSVFGICNVPLPLITTRRFLIGVDQGVTASYQWITSTDEFGATATATAPGACARPGTSGSSFFRTLVTNRGVQGDGFFVYPGDYTRGAPQPLRIYDGTVDQELVRVPINTWALANEGSANYASSAGWIINMLLVDTKLYFVSIDFILGASPHYSRVFEYDFETSVLRQIGAAASNATNDVGAASGGNLSFTCLAYHQGYLYAGAGPVVSGEASTAAGVYRIRPGIDSTWTFDFDSSASGEEFPTCMASYKGLLYVGTADFNSGAARMLVRSAVGAYTSSTTVGTNALSGWSDMKVFGDNLYACSYDVNGASSQTRIHKFDGSSWSVVKTIESGTATPKIGVAMLVHNGKLYVLALNTSKNGTVTSTSDGSSWTDTTSNLTSSNLVSIFGVLTD